MPSSDFERPPSPAPSTANGLYGRRPEKVIEAIRQRHLHRQRGLADPAGRKIALVLEGGGMRAAAAAGGALALGHLGLAEVFDEVYATSAAVMNASYFMSRQEDLGISIYFDDLTTRRFCNRLRLWKVLDVDYVITEIVQQRKRLDVEFLKKSRTRLHVSVMDHETGEAFVIDTTRSAEPLVKLLHAALAIPVFYNRTVQVEGRPCMDGGLTIPFPLQSAIDDGCTDILVLLSHPRSHQPTHRKPWQNLLFRLLCSRGRKGPWEAYVNSAYAARTARALAFGEGDVPPTVNIATVCTEGPTFLHTLSTDRSEMRAAANAYGRRTLAALGADPTDWNLGPASSAHWRSV